MLKVTLCSLLLWSALSKGEDAKSFISPKCDNMGVNTLLGMGLEPQLESNQECPCSWKWPEQKNNTCYFMGKYYNHGEEFMKKNVNNENPCTCNVRKGKQRIICEPSKWNLEWEPLDMNVTCKLEKETDYKGNEMFWPRNTCLTCKCKPDFKGEFIPPFCQRTSASISFQYQKEISRQCTPYYEIYNENENNPALCTPTGFICNEDIIEISPISVIMNSTDSNMCKIDNEFHPKGTVLNVTFIKYDFKHNIDCACSTPPLFTCLKNSYNRVDHFMEHSGTDNDYEIDPTHPPIPEEALRELEVTKRRT